MANYPIKMLRDEQGVPFVPLVSSDSVQTPEGVALEDKLKNKLETSDLIAGQYIDIEQNEQGNVVIGVDLPASVNTINNLTTEASGQGALDAYQGKVLKDSIPALVDSLDSTDANKALSARQGKILNEKTVPEGGKVGQVLKKSSNNDHELEWGDAADPNAIGGDGTIKKIVELSYQDYLTLQDNEELDETTEYHINDWTESGHSEITAAQVTTAEGNSLQEKLNNIDLIDEGQNTRLDVAEGNIDAVVNTVNNHASSLSNCETRINSLSNHAATNVMLVLSDYATSAKTVNFTFDSGLFLVMSQVNGNDMCRVDLVYNGDGSSIAGRSTICALSNYITYTYGTNSVTISTNYTCLVRILRMP